MSVNIYFISCYENVLILVLVNYNSPALKQGYYPYLKLKQTTTF